MKINKIQRLANQFLGSFLKTAKKSSAGFLFFCPEDQTIFLTKRSPGMNSPGTWDVSGGRHDDGDDNALDTANREAHEELTTLPAKRELIDRYDLPKSKDHKKKYVIFIYSVPLDSKKNWEPKLDPEENCEYRWFDLESIPKNTHFDLSWLKKRLSDKTQNSL